MRPFRAIKHFKTISKVEKKKNFFKKVLIQQAFINNTGTLTESNIESNYFKIFSANYLKFFYRFGNIGRHKNLCYLTSKPRSVIRHFKLARIAFRQLAVFGSVIGIKKASW